MKHYANHKKMKTSGSRWLLYIAGTVLIIITVVITVIFQRQVHALSNLSETGPDYKYHFAFVGDRSNSFQNAVYNDALKEAEKNGSYLEFTGKNLGTSYSVPELMNLAVSAKADGIIVNGDDSESLKSAINQAVKAGIPVICVGADSYGSKRQSFVGASYYNLGEKYGNMLRSLVKNRQQSVLVIASPEEKTTGQNLVISGMQSILEKNHVMNRFSISSKTLGDGDSFSTAEAVTNLFEEKNLPDILICLDETTTSSVCQTIVDTNRVGDVTIYGYYMNDTILNAIQKNVAALTLTVSTEEIGRTAVDNLLAYIKDGFVTEYSSIHIETITAENVQQYIDREAEEQ